MISPTKLPYSGTKVDPESTKMEIVRILKKFGILDHQWTEYHSEVKLEFETEVEFEGQKQPMHVILKPPQLKELHKVWDAKLGKTVKKEVLNWPVAYRLMKDHLKNRLTIVACGAHPFEEIFLADIALHHPQTGESVRLVDYMRSRGQIPGLQLEDKTEPPTENVIAQ